MTETKNGLSAILDRVKEGESFLITEHGKPVARLVPVREIDSRDEDEAWLADMERRGIIRRLGSGNVPRSIIDTPPPRLPKGLSALGALLDEREEGR